MNEPNIFSALILGLLEGLTEFIPVSSTAHLILAQHFLGFRTSGNTFPVLIQLGAILAILSVYFKKLLHVALTLPSSERSRWFVLSILVGFLPAAIIGAIAHDFIKEVLFESPLLICYVLIAGGIVLLAVDKIRFQPRYFDAMNYPLPLALKIGFFQCLAMVPGTSRSGATIVGALLMGADKRSAAEFSFFLAMPTMVGAFTLDVYKYRKEINADDMTLIAVGFVAAFISALLVVRSLLAFVSRRGYAPFAWWRIIVGVAGLAGLYLAPAAVAAPSLTEMSEMLAVKVDSATCADPSGQPTVVCTIKSAGTDSTKKFVKDATGKWSVVAE